MAKYIRKVDHATSVKEINVIRNSNNALYGTADFKHMPVFSVFDFGRIQPPVPLDNSTIALMQGVNFEILRNYGIESHYIGLVKPNGELIDSHQAIKEGKPIDTVRVKFVSRLQPKFIEGEGWDYSVFESSENDSYIIPLELISRNDLPESSSVWERVRKGQTTMEDLGLPANFKPGDKIDHSLVPILDYSTKFEPDDRYISPEEAKQIANLSPKRFERINKRTREASILMTDYAASRGFKRLDGKVEQISYVVNGIRVDVLGDAVCTWHEDRLTAFGLGISKQRIRNKIKKLNPEWVAEIERAKDEAIKKGVADFRTLMNPSIRYTSPDAAFFKAVNKLFRAATNQWIGSKFYKSTPGTRDSLIDGLERTVEEFKKVQ